MIVASRYAKSLLDLAVEKGQLEKVYADMQLINTVCKENREFMLLLQSPVIKTDKKKEVLTSIFKGKVNDMTMAFIGIIADKRREIYVHDIAKAFIEQYKTHKKILTAVITSSVGIDEATRNNVLALIKKTSQGEVELIEQVDKSLIGGFILKIGDRQVDKSVSHQLAKLKRELTNNTLN